MTFVVTAAIGTGAYFAAGAAGATAISSAAIGLLAGSTALGAVGQYQSGKQMEIQYKQQAEQEKLRAESEELIRRQELNRMLAGNIQSMAAGGVAGEGSPLSLALSGAKRASISEGVIGVSEKLKQAQLKRKAANSASQGRLAAASTLLQGGSKMASLYAPKDASQD